MKKEIIELENVFEKIDFCGRYSEILLIMHINLLRKTLEQLISYEEFKVYIENKGGFVSAHWDGSSETENKIKKETKLQFDVFQL
jgi:prolyl-tRNA synthetase